MFTMTNILWIAVNVLLLTTTGVLVGTCKPNSGSKQLPGNANKKR